MLTPAGWWVAGRLDGWVSGWLVGWLAGWLVGWLVGWLAGWLAGWLVGWLLAAGWEDDEVEGFQGLPTRSTLWRGRRMTGHAFLILKCSFQGFRTAWLITGQKFP